MIDKYHHIRVFRCIFIRRYLNRQGGFTLLEVSIVLLIMGFLLASVMQPMGARMMERQRNETLQQLSSIREALIGYAAVHHRLPCPVDAQAQSNCTSAHGYVPVVELGLSGHYDGRGLLVDSWGNPYRYHVSLSDSNNDGAADFVIAGQMREVSMQRLLPEFEVCEAATCGQLRANRLPVVLSSDGAGHSNSADESENQDSDNRFVSRDLDTVGADQFDDIVVWLSGNILYTRLLQAQVLP